MLFDEKKFRAALPAEMLSEKRWVRYFLKPKAEGGTAKIPLGNHSDPNTWSTFNECVKAIENDQQGVGYNFLGGDIHGLDIDHCRNPRTGVLCNEAMLLLSRIPSWAEFSVSGAGIHVLFKGHVRGKQLSESCLQYWNPNNSPRFFAITCEMVGDAFRTIRDVGEEFNYVFSTARHISAKIREELKTVDNEQWAALPAEREHQEVTRYEKSKTKTRKVVQGFDIKDFLSFYNIPIDNTADNEIGHCIRVATCPIKGEPHVGQNATTTNFVYPTKDGGVAFHCQSTGCVEYGIGDVVKRLADTQGVYPKGIYEPKAQPQTRQERPEVVRGHRLQDVCYSDIEPKVWIWPGYLFGNHLVHLAGASGEGKSPLTRDLIARFTSGREWPDGAANTSLKKRVLLLSSEDDWSTDILPHLKLADAAPELVKGFVSTATLNEETYDVVTALDKDVCELQKVLETFPDIGLIIIDPITNYLGGIGMNKEDELRPGLLMPLANLAHRFKVCILTVGHLNKRTEGELLDRVLGARAFAGVARQVLFCSKDPDEESRFAHILGLGRGSTFPNLKYSTSGKTYDFGGEQQEVVVIEWHGKSEADIEGAVTAPEKQADKSASKQVQVLMKALLRDGAKPSATVEQAIKEQGIVCLNWQRAAKKVAASRKTPGGGRNAQWEWYLPTAEQAEFDR